MPYNTAPRCPEPQEDHAGRTTRERKWKHALAYVAQLWRPSNTLEQTHATVSRYAMHLIDLTTGAAYTVQQLLGATASVAWSSITGKPTTLAGYGITDAAPGTITRTEAQGTPKQTRLTIDGGGYDGTIVNRSTTTYYSRPLYSTGIFRVEWTGTEWRFLANGVEVDVGDGETPWDATWGAITVTASDLAATAIGQNCRVGDESPYRWFVATEIAPTRWDEVAEKAPAAITRTAEQGAPNKNGVEVAKVGGPFVWDGFYSMMTTQYNGHPVFSKIEENGNFRRVIFRSVGGRWRNISTVAIDLDDQDTWEASTPDFSSQSTTSALPYPGLVWLDDDSQVDADLTVAAASTTPVTPTAIGQLCIVDASDVYVAAQVDPPIWLGPLN